jgi:hypothetical protein
MSSSSIPPHGLRATRALVSLGRAVPPFARTSGAVAYAASITSATFTGGSGTALVGGTLYARQGGALILTLTASSETRCVEIGGAHDVTIGEDFKANEPRQVAHHDERRPSKGDGPARHHREWVGDREVPSNDTRHQRQSPVLTDVCFNSFVITTA